MLKALFNLLATPFYSDLQAFYPVTLTNQQLPEKEGSANWGAPFSVPPFPSGCWLESFFLCRPVRLPEVLLSFSASQPWMAEETPSAWRGKAARNV